MSRPSMVSSKLLLLAQLACVLLPVSPVKAQSDVATNERALFLFRNGTQYFEVGSTHWQPYFSSATLCQSCTPYFVNYNLLGSNSFTPVHTGQELVPNLAKDGTITPGATVSLLDGKSFEGQMISIYLCQTGESPSKKTCVLPRDLFIRNLETSQIVFHINLPTLGDLFSLVQGQGGRLDIISEEERATALARLHNDATLVAEQRQQIDARNAAADAEQAAKRAAAQAASQMEIDQQATGSTLFCGNEVRSRNSIGDSVDRLSLVCHLVGKSNMAPLTGAWLLTHGWTVVSEFRKSAPDSGEETQVTLKKMAL